MNAFKNVAAIALETGYNLPELEAAKNASKNAAPVSTNKVETKAPVKVEEPEP